LRNEIRHREPVAGWVGVLALAVGLVVLLMAYLSLGHVSLTPLDLLTGELDATYGLLLELRLKRAAMAIGVGASLAVSGCAFQALLRNALADPFIVGVSGGAAVGGTLVMLPLASLVALGSALQATVVFAGSFAGALGATVLLFGMSWVRGMIATNHLLLMGVVFNFFASAVVMFMKSLLVGHRLHEVLFWLMGTLASESVSWGLVLLVAAIAVWGTMLLSAWGRGLDALAVGEEFAHGTGVDPERLKRRLFVVAALLVAGAVSIAGFVGFVGLVVPHMMRLVFGARHRLLFALCALGGAFFLLASDLVARLITPLVGTQLPVGVLTSLVGGPLFIVMLVRAQRHEVVS